MNAGYVASKKPYHIDATTVEKRIAQNTDSQNNMDVKVSMEQHKASFPAQIEIPTHKMQMQIS